MRPSFTLVVLLLASRVPRAQAHADTALALAALDAVIAETPGNAELYLRRASYRVEHAEWSAAEADVRRAAALAPDSPLVPLVRGRIFCATGRFPAARAQLNLAVRRDPADPEPLVWRARVLARLGAPQRAHDDYSAALRISGAPAPDIYLERASVSPSPELALAGLDEGIARIGPAPTLVEHALALELRLGRTDAALARLDALAANAERKETWLKRRGDILAAAGRMTEARAAYGSARAAIAALPAWLRNSPDVRRLAVELSRPGSNS